MTTMPPHSDRATRRTPASSAAINTGFKTPQDLRVQIPGFSKLHPENMNLSVAWYRTRAPWELATQNLSLTFSPHFLTVSVVNENDTRIGLLIGGIQTQLYVPNALVSLIIDSFGLPPDQLLRPETVTLLLEYRLSETLDILEQSLNATISIEGVSLKQIKAPLGFVIGGTCLLQNKIFKIALEAPPGLGPLFSACLAGLADRPVTTANVPTRAAFRVGATQITLRMLRSIRLNDVILTDSSTGVAEAMAIFGEQYGARARIEGRACALLGSPVKLSAQQKEVWSMAETSNLDRDAEAADAEFDDIQIKLVFEVGRREINVGELRRLMAGHVFDLGREPAAAVDIYAGTRRIGHGELVEINETLGVRVTRMFGDE